MDFKGLMFSFAHGSSDSLNVNLNDILDANDYAVKKTYRFTSDKEPSDTFLRVLMSQVGTDARRSSRKAKAELSRRMEETVRICSEE